MAAAGPAPITATREQLRTMVMDRIELVERLDDQEEYTNMYTLFVGKTERANSMLCLMSFVPL
jgi:hypothetical protein